MTPDPSSQLPASYVPAPYSSSPPPAPLGPGWDIEVEAPSIPLSHYLWVLRRHRWRIAALVMAATLLTLIVSYRLTPIYESTATIDVDRKMPTLILGQEAMQATNNDADQFLATQIRLIQSDSVLRPVAEKYNLREKEDEDWVSELKQDPGAAETPVILKKLKVSRPANTYLLLLSYRSKDKQMAADVANGIAQSYLEHTYNIRYRAASGLSQFMERQQEELRAKMERSSEALLKFERELNVINPEEKTNILSARLVQLNSEYTTAQADRVRREAALKSIQQGTSLEAAYISSQSESLDKLTQTYNIARQQFADIKSRFGANHPEYRRAQAQVEETTRLLDQTKKNIMERVGIEYRQAAEREAMLEKSVAEAKAEFDRVNSRSFEYQTIKREADADKKLYEELVRKIKEAGINASFQNSSIRIADPARPGLEPVFPRIGLNLGVAFLLSLMFAVGYALISDTLDDTIRDPEQAFRSLRTPVVGTLPQVKPWRSQLATIGAASGDEGTGGARSLSTYEEAIRTLRNSILLSDFERQFKTLLVTSASPSEGKSTIAIHLAVAHAQQHHRTLIIDGDLRRPSIHKRFGLPNTVGLSDVLLENLSWRDVLLHPETVSGLDILPAGSISRRAADLVGRGLQRILDDAAREYDLIILDAPPLLGFPEPLQMAAAADGVVIVARAGQTSRKGVASVISTLNRLRANIVGIVLNEVHREISDSYYYYGYYGKYYKHYRGESKTDLVSRES
ncbi:MAG: polysaccharide biosynthesis tyrosine autokinase [Bryobacteraceae bacterium]